MMTNYWLQLIRVYSLNLSYHSYLHLLVLIFRNYLIRGRVMLFVRHQNM